MHHPHLRPDTLTTGFEPDQAQLIAQNIRAPLAALRASMESLAHGFQSDDPRSLVLRGAAAEVQRLGRNVQALLDYALPPLLHPLDCSLDEIAHSALDGLSNDCKPGVLLAVENARARFSVDGPLLSRCLAHLIELGIDERAQTVLLSAREHDGGALFTVVHPRHERDGAPRPGAHSRVASLGLGLMLARRDVERMGGTLGMHETSAGRVVYTIQFQRAALARKAS